jgi:deoxyribodipyrimidine photolyase-related protein
VSVEALGGSLDRVPNELWLSSDEDFDTWAQGRLSLRMEHWYRVERRRTGWLMSDAAGRPARPGDRTATPVGGTWNLDRENRRRVPEAMHFPSPPTFAPDALTRAVIEQVGREYTAHPGDLEGFDWPVTREQALLCLDDFIARRLSDFGPYQDALVDGERALAHSLLSVPLNLGLLTPREVCERVLEAWLARPEIPLSSTEGFVRQVLGWREFLRHVYRRGMPGLALADGLGHAADLPAFYWSGETRMRCLGEAVRGVLATGHAHHIQRLMVLGNWALLAGVEARQVDEWFLEFFVDAFDWVVMPNVMGMSQWADRRFTSKPYVSGGSYLDRMGDHCGRCPYDPRSSRGPHACPFSALYWAFIDRHALLLGSNARMGTAVRAWLRRDPADRVAVLGRADEVTRLARRGDL